MRGKDAQQSPMFSYVSLEDRVPEDHPIRAIRGILDTALKGLEGTFRRMYSKNGRPSIAPEKLLRALILQILYTIPSERQLVERLNYDLLFKWFVGLNIDDPVWHATVYSKNRDRLLHFDLAQKLFEKVKEQAQAKHLLSKDHFTVDGSLIEACASIKSFVPKDDRGDDDDQGNGSRNADKNFHGKKLKNETHASTTDPDSRLFTKGQGQEAKLRYIGHLLTENRNGLIVENELTLATGTAERESAARMIEPQTKASRITLGGDKNYDTAGFVDQLRGMNVTPHVATKKTTKLDGRTLNTAGYEMSQRKRKRVEECFGWMKTVGLLRKLRHRGLGHVQWIFALTAVSYNMVRIKNLAYT